MAEPTEIKTEDNCRERQPLTRENEARNLMDSYSKTLDQWKLLNENYFKRVQVMMGILQAGLFLAAFRQLSLFAESFADVFLRIFLGILGILSSFMWVKLYTKQAQYLELCKTILRNLEARLTNMGVPLEYFTDESVIFGPYRVHPPTLIGGEFKQVPNEERNFLTLKWSQETYPPKTKDRKGLQSVVKVTGGLVRLERRLAQGALCVWIVVVVGTLLHAVLK